MTGKKVWDPLVDDYITQSGFVRNITDILPEGTEIFLGITLKLEDVNGRMEWTQKSAFSKVQSLGKAKKTPKYTPKQGAKMSEDKKVADEFKQIKISEDEF